jgi:hypothetical protein
VNFDNFEISAFASNLLNDHPTLNLIRNVVDARFGAYTIRPLTVGVTGVVRWH